MLAHYGQAYIHLKDTFDFGEDVRKGQTNGLLGAAFPTTLFLTFGLHTGNVRLAVRIADACPPIEPSWEEIVEASFCMPQSGELGLSDWNGLLWCPVPIAPGSYRVRYCAAQFAQAEDLDEAVNDADPIERYEVVFWPAAAAPDAVLRVTRPTAQYWHDVAQGKAR